MIYIGIDPGASGGIGVINTNDDTSMAIPYSEDDLHCVLTAYTNAKVMVERVHAMPGQGVTSMFNFGKSYGYILGALDAYMIAYELVDPIKWKREFSVTAKKDSSIACCRRLFPTVDLRRNQKCRKDHDGMAEALLIAEYARRRMK